MKKKPLFLLFFVQSLIAGPNDDFVITIKTDNPGFTTTEMFRIPTKSSLTYNYNVDCNDDGNDEATNQTGDYTCDYSFFGLNLGAGTYTIRIKDNTSTGAGFPSINFNNTFDRLKILSIEQWGTGIWTNMQRAFYGAENLVINATDTPNFSQVTTMESMFRRALVANPDTSLWDTSMVTNMKSLFNEAEVATPDTSQWDTHLVTDMSFMFRHAFLAEPDVRSWNVEQVGDFTGMFSAVSLPTAVYSRLLIEFNNQNLQAALTLDANASYYCGVLAVTAHANMLASDGWTINDLGECLAGDPGHDYVFEVDTSIAGETSNTQYLVQTSSSYDYDYNIDCNDDGTFEAMAQTGDFTCDYSALGGVGIYTVRIQDNVGDGSGFVAFKSIAFGSNTDQKKIISLKQWGTMHWQSMSNAFKLASNMHDKTFDVPDFSNVTTMSFMYDRASAVNPDTKLWDTSHVTLMVSMFLYASNAKPNTSAWDTSLLTSTHSMFEFATSANPDTSSWDTSKVTNMRAMFHGATVANPDTSSWDTSMVTNMRDMFHGATIANPDTSTWDTSMVTSFQSMFWDAVAANPDTSTWDTSSATDMSYMFVSATSANPDTSSWNIENVTTMLNMFSGVTLPTSSYDAMLTGFSQQNVHASVPFNGGSSKYCAVTAHDYLDVTKSWTMTDGGIDPTCVNQDPTMSGLPTDITVTEDVASPLNLSAATFADVDSGTSNVTLSVAVNSGTLTANNPPPIGMLITTFVSGSPIIFTGTQAAIDTYLSDANAISYTSALNNNGNNADLLTLTANDGGNTGTGGGSDVVLGSVNMDILAVNDEPSFSVSGDVIIDSQITSYQQAGFATVLSFGASDEESTQQVDFYSLNVIFDPQNIINQSSIDATGLLNLGFNNTPGVAIVEAVLHDNGGIAHGGDDTSQAVEFKVYYHEIFKNGFEQVVVVFDANQKSFNYDITKLDNFALGQKPVLIAKGLTFNDEMVVKVYLRKIDQQLQIQIHSLNNGVWEYEDWQDISRADLTTISW